MFEFLFTGTEIAKENFAKTNVTEILSSFRTFTKQKTLKNSRKIFSSQITNNNWEKKLDSHFRILNNHKRKYASEENLVSKIFEEEFYNLIIYGFENYKKHV